MFRKRTPKIEPPSFLKRIGDCEIFRGMAAKFTACVTGYPEPYYEWYKSDERLFASDRIKMEREGTGILRLIINRVVPEHDLTTYKLRIYNDYGEATCEANLLLDSKFSMDDLIKLFIHLAFSKNINRQKLNSQMRRGYASRTFPEISLYTSILT